MCLPRVPTPHPKTTIGDESRLSQVESWPYSLACGEKINRFPFEIIDFGVGGTCVESVGGGYDGMSP